MTSLYNNNLCPCCPCSCLNCTCFCLCTCHKKSGLKEGHSNIENLSVYNGSYDYYKKKMEERNRIMENITKEIIKPSNYMPITKFKINNFMKFAKKKESKKPLSLLEIYNINISNKKKFFNNKNLKHLVCKNGGSKKKSKINNNLHKDFKVYKGPIKTKKNYVNAPSTSIKNTPTRTKERFSSSYKKQLEKTNKVLTRTFNNYMTDNENDDFIHRRGNKLLTEPTQYSSDRQAFYNIYNNRNSPNISFLNNQSIKKKNDYYNEKPYQIYTESNVHEENNSNKYKSYKKNNDDIDNKENSNNNKIKQLKTEPSILSKIIKKIRITNIKDKKINTPNNHRINIYNNKNYYQKYICTEPSNNYNNSNSTVSCGEMRLNFNYRNSDLYKNFFGEEQKKDNVNLTSVLNKDKEILKLKSELYDAKLKIFLLEKELDNIKKLNDNKFKFNIITCYSLQIPSSSQDISVSTHKLKELESNINEKSLKLMTFRKRKFNELVIQLQETLYIENSKKKINTIINEYIVDKNKNEENINNYKENYYKIDEKYKENNLEIYKEKNEKLKSINLIKNINIRPIYSEKYKEKRNNSEVINRVYKKINIKSNNEERIIPKNNIINLSTNECRKERNNCSINREKSTLSQKLYINTDLSINIDKEKEKKNNVSSLISKSTIYTPYPDNKGKNMLSYNSENNSFGLVNFADFGNFEDIFKESNIENNSNFNYENNNGYNTIEEKSYTKTTDNTEDNNIGNDKIMINSVKERNNYTYNNNYLNLSNNGNKNDNINNLNNDISNLIFGKNKRKISGNLYLNYCGMLYIVTGKNFNKFFVFNSIKKNICKLSELLNPHPFGVLISHGNRIICLGGIHTKSVEVFNRTKNIWKKMPDMLYCRGLFSSCIIGGRYLFACYGVDIWNNNIIIEKNNIDNLNNKGKKIENKKLLEKDIDNFNIKYNNTIEVLDLTNEENGWKLLKIKGGDNINICGHIGFNFNDSKIIFLGGYNPKEKSFKNKFWYINLNEKFLDNDNCIEEIGKEYALVNTSDGYFFDKGYMCYMNDKRQHILQAFDDKYRIHKLVIEELIHDVIIYE